MTWRQMTTDLEERGPAERGVLQGAGGGAASGPLPPQPQPPVADHRGGGEGGGVGLTPLAVKDLGRPGVRGMDGVDGREKEKETGREGERETGR